MTLLLLAALQILALAYALLAGVFLAFSDFIMRALSRTDRGIEAMQSINREVFRWVFMPVFIGLAPLSLALVAFGFIQIGGSIGMMMALAGILYLFGCFAVTAALNVPMNAALGAMAPDGPDTREYWRNVYLPRWSFWNSVRAVACCMSAGILIVVLSGAGATQFT